MKLSDCRVHKFLAGLKDSKRIEERLMTKFDKFFFSTSEDRPEGQAVHQQYYIGVLTSLPERVRRKRPMCGGKNNGLFTRAMPQATIQCLERSF
ncbi:hypothetical protein AVEN_252215-1 [Araneus ventricosus]|uniref:Uncharacterized protein n=1 Tax=Araneus ventricosus TaxID=182803 RepID=A0A4Y2UTZ1_ARAVE|nr:hypothetical protein AVEN_252215-1 [Araneus ventricosus]